MTEFFSFHNQLIKQKISISVEKNAEIFVMNLGLSAFIYCKRVKGSSPFGAA